MKLKTETIITITILIFIIISFIIDIDNYVPGVSQIFPFIGIFLLIFDIYKSHKYLKNKPKDEIRIRNNNDSYFYLLPFIIGSIFCLTSLIIFFLNENKTMSILLFLSGLILIFKGLTFVPNALIKIENGILHLENGKVIEKLKIDSLEKIIIRKDNIEFKIVKDKKIIFSHLELNLAEIESTRNFLKENTKANLL